MKFFTYIIVWGVLGWSSLYASSVATITAIKGTVSIENETKVRVANLGEKLITSDSVVTQSKSKAQIIFKDETIVTVGKNSKFSIKKYLYEEGNNVGVEFSLLRGSMRAITGRIGKIAPQKFHVKTKTATIGIRGTNFTLVESPDNSFEAYCTYGAISVSIEDKEYIIKQGYYLHKSQDGRVVVQKYTSKILAAMKAEQFSTKKSSPLYDAKTFQTKENAIIRDVTHKMQDAIQTDSGTIDKGVSTPTQTQGQTTPGA